MVYDFPIGAYGTFECDKEGNAETLQCIANSVILRLIFVLCL